MDSPGQPTSSSYFSPKKRAFGSFPARAAFLDKLHPTTTLKADSSSPSLLISKKIFSIKLYGREDAFGTGDSLTVIAIMKFVLLPNERIHFKNAWIIFYGAVFFLMVFKGSHIPLRGNVRGKPAEDKDIEAQNLSQTTLIQSGSHGESWRLPLNTSHLCGESDAIELNKSST
ncbi:hypothetical protein Bca4012_085718 [Brassica carinata]